MGLNQTYDKSIASNNSNIPPSYFQRSLVEISYDIVKQTLTLFSKNFKNIKQRFLLDSNFWIQNKLKPFEVLIKKIDTVECKKLYIQKTESILEHIRAGDIYQANISHRFKFEAQLDPFLFFLELLNRNPTPYSAFCNITECTIISASPELLIKKEKDYLYSRPIKGTRPRGKTFEEDERNKIELCHSVKELAELAMITDLMRNDLGKIAKPKTVKVDELFKLETYSSVHHLVSKISCTPIENLTSINILKEVFPGGSITGCPKRRAMEIICEIEKEPRGVYTGSIGIFKKGGDFHFNITIRTCVKEGNNYTLGLGSGIVIDSIPEKEYEETLHKGKPFFNILGIDIP